MYNSTLLAAGHLRSKSGLAPGDEGRKSANDRSMLVSAYTGPAVAAGGRAAGPTPRLVNVRASNSRANPSSSVDLNTLDVVSFQEKEGAKQARDRGK